MRVEILYPQVCCLYGDKANMMYLRRCLPEAEFIETSLTDEPSFVREDIDLVYLCSMSEQNQEVVIDLLTPYRDRIRSLMDEERTVFLLTGNALELVGTYIEREDGSRKEALGLFGLHAVRQTPRRFNSLILADFLGAKIVGYTSRFSHSYVDEPDLYGRGTDVEAGGVSSPGAEGGIITKTARTGDGSRDPATLLGGETTKDGNDLAIMPYPYDPQMSLFTVVKGVGLNPDTTLEGILTPSVYATYLLGPLLIANPDFTKHLLEKLGAHTGTLPFDKEVQLAYEKKLAEYSKPGLDLE
ncbi:MAG: hypothetical protein FWF25_05895 [Propionibacteriaceae bacterium]|nr:hypothetical protein [Propionibacteriaceae bacterium]